MLLIITDNETHKRVRARLLGKIRYQGYELGARFRQHRVGPLQAIAYLLKFRGEAQRQGVGLDTCNAYCEAFVRGYGER